MATIQAGIPQLVHTVQTKGHQTTSATDFRIVPRALVPDHRKNPVFSNRVKPLVLWTRTLGTVVDLLECPNSTQHYMNVTKRRKVSIIMSEDIIFIEHLRVAQVNSVKYVLQTYNGTAKDFNKNVRKTLLNIQKLITFAPGVGCNLTSL